MGQDYVLFEFAHDLVVEFLLDFRILGQEVGSVGEGGGGGVESSQQENNRLRRAKDIVISCSRSSTVGLDRTWATMISSVSSLVKAVTFLPSTILVTS